MKTTVAALGLILLLAALPAHGGEAYITETEDRIIIEYQGNAAGKASEKVPPEQPNDTSPQQVMSNSTPEPPARDIEARKNFRPPRATPEPRKSRRTPRPTPSPASPEE